MTTHAFSLQRDQLPHWLHPTVLTLPTGASLDCSGEEWHDCLLVLEAGRLVLATADGEVALLQGAVFALTGLHAMLHNRCPAEAVLSTARRPPHPPDTEET